MHFHNTSNQKRKKPYFKSLNGISCEHLQAVAVISVVLRVPSVTQCAAQDVHAVGAHETAAVGFSDKIR